MTQRKNTTPRHNATAPQLAVMFRALGVELRDAYDTATDVDDLLAFIDLAAMRADIALDLMERSEEPPMV